MELSRCNTFCLTLESAAKLKSASVKEVGSYLINLIQHFIALCNSVWNQIWWQAYICHPCRETITNRNLRSHLAWLARGASSKALLVSVKVHYDSRINCETCEVFRMSIMVWPLKYSDYTILKVLELLQVKFDNDHDFSFKLCSVLVQSACVDMGFEIWG